MDRSDEAGDPACWSHLFDEEPDLVDPGHDELWALTVALEESQHDRDREPRR